MQRGLLVKFSCNPHYEIVSLELCWSKQTTSAVTVSGCYNKSDMDERSFQIQRMLADELDRYKGKDNKYVKENIQEILELYKDEEK